MFTFRPPPSCRPFQPNAIIRKIPFSATFKRHGISFAKTKETASIIRRALSFLEPRGDAMIAMNFPTGRVNGLRVVTPSEEMRRMPRHAHSLPLTLSVFNRDQFFEGWMINYSPDGVCAEICHGILPGTSVHFHIDESSARAEERAVCHCFRSTALGEVKWCQAFGQGPARRYRIGIRYYCYY